MKQAPFEDFGIRLQQAMKKAGVNGRALHKKVGVREATVSSWRSGQFMPEDERLELVAKALAVSPQWLRYGNPGDAARPVRVVSESTPDEYSRPALWHLEVYRQQTANYVETIDQLQQHLEKELGLERDAQSLAKLQRCTATIGDCVKRIKAVEKLVQRDIAIHLESLPDNPFANLARIAAIEAATQAATDAENVQSEAQSKDDPPASSQ